MPTRNRLFRKPGDRLRPVGADALASPTKPQGAAPGALYAAADAAATVVYWCRYGADAHATGRLADLAELDAVLALPGTLLWLDVRGLRDHALLQALAQRFDIHPLALADMVNVPQRPKTEAYDTQLLCVMHMAQVEERAVLVEQVSVLVGDGFVVTVQEDDEIADVLEPVRRRLVDPVRGRLRASGADYLAYALIDAIVDAWFPVLEAVGEELEDLELRVLRDPRPASGREIHALKRTLLHLRRSIWPQRDALGALLRGNESVLQPATLLYLRDVYDHAAHVVDMVEVYREFSSSLMDVYFSSVDNRMNEVIKVLTMMSTVFLPLSFVAGVYGMNFDRGSPWNMPELGWRFGYPFALGVMALLAVGLLWWFRRVGWLGRKVLHPHAPHVHHDDHGAA